MMEQSAQSARQRAAFAVVLVSLLALSGCLSISAPDYDEDDGYYGYDDGYYYRHGNRYYHDHD